MPPTFSVSETRFVYVDGVKIGRLTETGFIEFLAPRPGRRDQPRRRTVVGPADLLRLAVFCREAAEGGAFSEEL